MDLATIIADAKRLTPEERSVVLDVLTPSEELPGMEVIERAQTAQAERRLEDILTGRERTIPLEQLMIELRKKFA